MALAGRRGDRRDRSARRGFTPESYYETSYDYATLRDGLLALLVDRETHRCVLARWDDDALTVWASTQTPSILRTALAATLDVPETRVRIIVPDVGGGFGLKMHVFPEDVAIAAIARLP